MNLFTKFVSFFLVVAMTTTSTTQAHRDGLGGGIKTAVSDICDGTVETTSCMVPRKHRGRWFQADSGEVVEGVYICKTRTPREDSSDEEGDEEVELEPFSFSECVVADGMVRGDGANAECGCCGGVCPEPCPCGCDVTDRDGNVKTDDEGNPIAGAYVSFGEEGEDKCVPALKAMAMVEKSNGRITCGGTCEDA